MARMLIVVDVLATAWLFNIEAPKESQPALRPSLRCKLCAGWDSFEASRLKCHAVASAST